MSNERLGIVEERQADRLRFARHFQPPNRVAVKPSPPAPVVPPVIAPEATPRLRPAPPVEMRFPTAVECAPDPIVHTPYRPSIAQVQRAFCDGMVDAGYTVDGRPYGMTDLISHRRSQIVACPRHVCISLAHLLCNASTPLLGKHFDRIDHTSVLHAIKRTARHMELIPVLAEVHAKVLAHFEAAQ